MRPTGNWIRATLVLLLAASIVWGSGCASTKNVMNKATFGMVGGDSEEKAVKKEAKRQAEEQKKAEKQARKERKRAEKQARDEEKRMAKAEQPEDSERGFMSKATLGLIGGDSEDKAAKKEAKRQEEEQKKAEKQARKEQKKAEKQARKQEEQIAKEQTDRTERTDPSDRSLLSKATSGLVSGDSEDKAAKKEAKRQAEEQKKAEKQAQNEQKKAEKQARKQEEQIAKEQTDQTDPSDRSFLSKATFGLVGDDSEEKTAKKEATRQEEEQKKAEKRAAKEQKKAEEQAREEEKKMAKAETDSPDEPKRGLMSKLTFGLVGGGENEEDQTVEQEMPASTPEPPVPMAATSGDYDVQPESEMTNDARKLAKLPFETAVSYDSMSASGKQQAVASRVTYSKHDYGITDLGDVRIAVRDMTFSGGTRGGRVIVSSEDRAKASGSAGIGNESFSFNYEKGVTACTFGTVQFTIELGVITIDGRSVPMGKGHKLVVVDPQGNVDGVYDIE